MSRTASMIVADVRARAAASDDPLWADFVDACLNDVLGDTIKTRSADALLAAARDQFALLCRPRRPGEIVADVKPVPDETGYCDTALLTVIEDTAFLVDTVGMAVRELGADIDWILHPVVGVTRDADGQVTAVRSASESASAEDDTLESLIRLEFAAPAGLDPHALVARVQASLADLQQVVADWQPMRQVVQQVVDALDRVPCGVDRVECAETQEFLRWLADDRLTLLGYRCRQIDRDAEGTPSMTDVPGSSLGLLREDRSAVDPDGYVASPEVLDRYTRSPRILVITKANTRAWIHHAETMDVLAIKRLDATGNVIGAHRFLGLFSSEAYAASPRDIPLLRQKLREVTTRAALRRGSHTDKSLRYILETFPRDELFQSSEAELYRTVMGVLGMRETERLRLFMRRDRYDRFYSCLVYMPRERYSLALRGRIERELAARLGGTVQESDAQFLRGALVRVHYQIARRRAGDERIDPDTLEHELLEATRAWPDRFAAATRATGLLMPAYANAFDAAYRARFDGAAAVADAAILAKLDVGDAPVLRVIGRTRNGDVQLKLYGGGEEIPLSQVLPVLENFGLSVHTQRPFMVRRSGRKPQWVHEYEAEHPQAESLEQSSRAASVSQAFADIMDGRAEDDGLNRLVVAAGFRPRQVVLVRTITRYLLQTELPYSPIYIQDQLADHAELVAMLVALFERRFDPERRAAPQAENQAENQGDEDQAIEAILGALDAVASLDADRVLRAFFSVVKAALRTNYYQPDAHNRPKPYVSIKLDPAYMPELPRPLPMFEAFVYAPEVEGVHLRGGRVARGGLRWSDRREDFRTEVLGLMKAQMVKNAVIVPVGAKGGFVVKQAAADDSREARVARGVACYKTFIRGLLDITDNRVGDTIEHPPQVVRYDGDDPYLVVAADKGTATFSDIANDLSREYGFWLDDAFASGGSAGYDHKALGITAKGAWEGVKRHFRELGRDIQREPFTAVGVGDMGGDVFGNGMLLSAHLRLIAAFNHRHIFIDPDPDAAASFAERQRLFGGPQSGWSDYDPALISRGGGVYERSAKQIVLSAEARAALELDGERFTPSALIRELLCAPVDLLWNGGIGTYVKAGTESHAAVGDRANDAVRVDGRELRARVVGEGGNLGLTQSGRIEYALAGGRLNTDAIDNSGGVDCSDLEVNIKIALGTEEAAGALTREARNALLADMSDGVAALVLRSNYLQTQQISLLEDDNLARFDEQISFMRALEREGRLDRRLEQLPDDEAVQERLNKRQGLTRPELAVLVSYSKIALADAVLASDLPDDPWLRRVLEAGFPQALVARFPAAVAGHRLQRELITTLLTNQMVDRLGIATAHRLPAGFSTRMDAAARAYVLADAWLGGEQLFQAIEALDTRISSVSQHALHKIVIGLLKHAMSWYLGTPCIDGDITNLVARFQGDAQILLEHLPDCLTGDYARHWKADYDYWCEQALDQALAARVASANTGGGIMDIVALAEEYERDATSVARLYYAVGDELSVAWLQDAIHALPANGRWQALARASMRGDSYRLHERIVAEVLAVDADDPLAEWQRIHRRTLDFLAARIGELRNIERPGHEHLSVVVRDLARLASTQPTSLAGAT